MKMKTKLLAIAAAVALGLGLSAAPASAAPPQKGPTAAETVYLDPDGMEAYSTQLATAAADWSKNTGVNVVIADCTGENCVHMSVISTIPCSPGGVVVGLIGGCAHASSDPGACQIEFYDYALQRDYWLSQYIVTHEVGHCVFWFGDKTRAFYHLDSKNAIMKDGFGGYPRESQTRLTSEDRRWAQMLYAS